MIYFAFFAGVGVGVTGFMAILMIGVPDEPRRIPRLSTIINTAFVEKMKDERPPDC